MLTIEKVATKVRDQKVVYLSAVGTKTPQPFYIRLAPAEIPFEAVALDLELYDSIQCDECFTQLQQCIHNPLRGKTAEAYQLEVRERAATFTIVADEDGNFTPSGRKPRITAEPDLTEEIRREIIETYVKGATQAQTSAQFPDYKGLTVMAVIKDAGVTRAQGSSRGRVKTTVDTNPTMIAEALVRYNAGEGMAAMAKEYNVNQMVFSMSLKDAGAIIKRGPRK